MGLVPGLEEIEPKQLQAIIVDNNDSK